MKNGITNSEEGIRSNAYNRQNKERNPLQSDLIVCVVFERMWRAQNQIVLHVFNIQIVLHVFDIQSDVTENTCKLKCE